MRRQEEVLYRPESPAKLFAIMDESALRRPIGPPEVMAAQVEKLIESSDLPNVVVQVIPITRKGAHPALDGRFSVLRFADTAIPDTVYVEGLLGELFLNRESEVVRYVEIFDYLAGAVAESPADSLNTLHQLHTYWKSSPS